MFKLLFAAFFTLSSLSIAHAENSAFNLKANKVAKEKEEGPSYNKLIVDVTKRIDSLVKLALGRGNDWLIRERLANALLERAGLTNSFEDYSRIEKVLSEAFSIAPKGSGPLLVAARFNYATHRLSETEKYLDIIANQAIRKDTTSLALASMRANLNFQRGKYEDAYMGYQKCESLRVGFCSADLALHLAKTGKQTEAESIFTKIFNTADQNDSRLKSWVKLQLGIIKLEQGDYDAALERLQEANAILPGWWLIEEHIAEINFLKGNNKAAISIYEEIVQKTNMPQFMVALAECYKKDLRLTEATDLINKAETAWNEKLAIFPEAASGHALDFYLETSPNPKKALELAKRNFETRPNTEARIYLAEAYLANNKPALAQEQMEVVLSTPYRSAKAYDVASKTFFAVGDKAKAEQNKAECLKINPRYY
jgi:tetratricopeptide (TPR) repeat protein